MRRNFWIIAGAFSLVALLAPLAVAGPDQFGRTPVAYPPMARTTDSCLSATWTTDFDGGGFGPALLAADGGVPVPGRIYVCTATGDGCFSHVSQPHSCSFKARFSAGGTTFESFPLDANDAGTPAPQVYGLGLGASTTFDCCPYLPQQ